MWPAATVILLLAVALLYFRGEPGCELAGGNTLYLSRLGAETMRARFCYAADCRLVAEQMTKAESASWYAAEGDHVCWAGCGAHPGVGAPPPHCYGFAHVALGEAISSKARSAMRLSIRSTATLSFRLWRALVRRSSLGVPP